MSMRLHFIFLIPLVIISGVLSAQPRNTSGIDYTTEIQKSAGVPNSPEAQAFTKYGNTSVSLYTGQPNIGVPLYEYQGRELSLPVSLTYDASGVKVDQFATQTGLGWNLRFGGRISRIVNGAPDDFLNASAEYLTILDPSVRAQIQQYTANNTVFETEQASRNYLQFLKDMSTGFIDAQPDYYSLNVLGMSGYIAFDVNTLEPKVLNNPRVAVEAVYNSQGNSLESWVVTGEDGTVYTFGRAEMTRYEGNDYSSPSDSPEIFGLTKDYNSSWVLTKIVSPNGKDIYDMNYVSFGPWSEFADYIGIVSETNASCDNNAQATTHPIGSGQVSYFRPKYKIDQLFISELRHNGNKIISFDLEQRYDMDVPSALKHIKIHHPVDPATIIRDFEFDYSYFGVTGSTDPSTQVMSSIRLKLNKVKIKADGQTDQTYRFTYINPHLVPDRNSLDRDYLGYYTGRNNQTGVLYPRITVGQDIYEGANLSPNGLSSQVGTLNRIYYPTGGYTQFSYGLPYTTRVYTPGPSITFTNLGGNTLTGGQDDSNADQCTFPICEGKFGQIPKISHTVFEVNIAGSKRIDYNTNGGRTEAHLFKINSRSDVRQFKDIVYGSGPGQITYKWSRLNDGTTNGIEPSFENLEVGFYQITLVSINTNNVVDVQVYGDKITQPGPIEVTDYKAGLRVENILDYTDQGTLASTKEYRYTTTIDGAESSASVIFEPVLHYSTDRETFLQEVPVNFCGFGPGVNTMRYEHRVTSSSGGMLPHIAYSTVFERRITYDQIGAQVIKQIEGYTKYNFNTGRTGIVSTGLPPNANTYYVNYDVGKEHDVSVYNQEHKVLSRNTLEYGGDSYFSTRGIYPVFFEENTFRYPQIEHDINQGNYRIRYVAPDILQFRGEIIAGPLSTELPPSCDEPQNTCINNFDLSPHGMALTGAIGAVDHTVSVDATEYVYDEFGVANEITKRTEMEYAPELDYLNTKTTTWGSDDEVVIERKFYPKHFDSYPYTNLVAEHKLNTVVEEQTIKNGIEIQNRKVDFLETNGRMLPSTLAVATGGPLEDRISYRYDDNHNLIEAIQISDPSIGVTVDDFRTTFLWGYNKRFLVAKIENATPTEVDAVLGASRSVLNEALPDDNLLRNTLGVLRDQLPDARVTIYTHKYEAGVSSITDPNGVISRYEYDAMNRLIAVYQSGEKVQEYDYQYLTQE